MSDLSKYLSLTVPVCIVLLYIAKLEMRINTLETCRALTGTNPQTTGEPKP